MYADPANIKKVAEEYYRRGDLYCSEAIVKAVKDSFKLDLPEDVVAMASGFPVGIGGSGCTCGAVSGGIMALGMFFGRTEPGDEKVSKTMELAKEIHDKFKENHKNLCCRSLTRGMELGSPEHLEMCIALTGEVAEEVALIVNRELI